MSARSSKKGGKKKAGKGSKSSGFVDAEKAPSSEPSVVKQPLFLSTFRGESMLIDLDDKAVDAKTNKVLKDKLAYETIGDVMSAVERLWGLPKERLCLVVGQKYIDWPTNNRDSLLKAFGKDPAKLALHETVYVSLSGLQELCAIELL